MHKIIVLIGAPGAGKGTQARLLEERRGIPQISTGDMFREMKSSNTPLALEIQRIMKEGGLVPDDLTYKMVKERTEKEDCKGTYVLDGFPRNVIQADMLEELAKEQNKKVKAFLIDVDSDILEKRLTGRRTCKVCGEIFNIYFKPPTKCDRPECDLEKNLVQREDDNLESVRKRLITYEESTKPLIEYYEKSGRLVKINGDREVEQIYSEISRSIDDNS
ncbi:MAG: adenylate kinase [Pyrinomonadaceae bacterium]|nr:adenylate kinase [Pyrinomonadaceae bacterium]MCX7639362.1 adenylate kinase [Pyrinomonadaceae bacterium]MDW8305222.1 adenylate kinase [Acidobacteriota bacterium]